MIQLSRVTDWKAWSLKTLTATFYTPNRRLFVWFCMLQLISHPRNRKTLVRSGHPSRHFQATGYYGAKMSQWRHWFMVLALATVAGSVSEECLFARPVITGRARWENQPVGPGHSVLVVDVRPAESEPWVADKAFWTVRRPSVVSRAQTNFVKSKDGLSSRWHRRKGHYSVENIFSVWRDRSSSSSCYRRWRSTDAQCRGWQRELWLFPEILLWWRKKTTSANQIPFEKR